MTATDDAKALEDTDPDSQPRGLQEKGSVIASQEENRRGRALRLSSAANGYAA